VTRYELIWCTAFATSFAKRIDRLIDLGDNADGQPFYNEQSCAKAWEHAEKVANLAADSSIGRGPK
jgi:hypothetical protein